jgi:predicted kinase
MLEEQPGSNFAPVLMVMVGLPGTGKSYLVREVAQRVSVDIVQTDEIRRTLVARPEYTPEENQRVFTEAHRESERLLRQGHSVVFDATNVYARGRRILYNIAKSTGARLLIVRTDAPDATVMERLNHRALGADPSDRSQAGWDVYVRMKSRFEPIKQPHLRVDTSQDVLPAVQEIAQFIQGVMGDR